MGQAIPQIDNSDAYHTISWIMKNADMGFYIVIASSHMQRKIAEQYITSRVAIYDYSQNAKPYSYNDINAWAKANEGEDVYFILNMQLAFMDEVGFISDNNMLSFNMSRDLLANVRKIWIFFMTDEAEYRLSTFAYDIYSYIRQKAYFLDEEESDFEGAHILEFDEYPDYAKIEATLARYKDIEKQCMDFPLEGTPNARLLSAAVTLSNIVRLYAECAHYNEALNLLFRIKDIREKVLDNKHPDIAAVYNSIGLFYARQGHYNKALEWYIKAKDIYIEILGDEHPDTANVYENIGFVYLQQGLYINALEIYHKALAIREKVLGVLHPDTASIFNNIANLFTIQEDYTNALELYGKALAIWENFFGSEHPKIAAAYNNIANVYYNQQNYSKALEWYGKALDITVKVYGDEHPNTASVYNGIATICAIQGDFKKALELYRKVLSIQKKVLGDNHPETIATLNNIAIAGGLAGSSY